MERRVTNTQMINRQPYVKGTTLTKEEFLQELERPYEFVDPKTKKNKKKVKRWSFGYALFLSAAVFLAAVSLVSYIAVRSELSVAVRTIASLESELNNKKLTNDENLQRIESSVNLEEIKRIAVEELGMTYATDGQVVTISDEGSDYVRQMVEIPLY